MDFRRYTGAELDQKQFGLVQSGQDDEAHRVFLGGSPFRARHVMLLMARTDSILS